MHGVSKVYRSKRTQGCVGKGRASSRCVVHGPTRGLGPLSVVVLPWVLAVGCADASGPRGPAVAEFEREDSFAEGPLEGPDGPTLPVPPIASRDAAVPEAQWGGRDAGQGAHTPGPSAAPNVDDPTQPASDPFAAEAVCSSDSYWSGGTSELMHPGVACIACHGRNARAPQFTVAGTLYPTAHEPDDCHALGLEAARVEITGADGRRFELAVNSVGNFFSLDEVAMPYSARVISQGRVRTMVSRQRSGDCNGCHTQAGNAGAPGRVLAP
jgi:hypothetical protein